MALKKIRYEATMLLLIFFIILLSYFVIPSFVATNYSAGLSRETFTEQNSRKITHIKTPAEVKAIYMSQCVVGAKNFREELVRIADATEINSIVIDIKDYTGKISFQPKNTDLSQSVSKACGAPDMAEFIEYLHVKNIYVIGRITVFQDPYMTQMHPKLAVKRASNSEVWKDFKGLSFIDVGAKEFWDYIIDISKEAYAIGFDELNYDYIRFPSDGNITDIAFPLSSTKSKPQALKEFFIYLHNQMKDPRAFSGQAPILSADIFGMTTTAESDLNIGQVLENTLPYFDYVAPMVYPSHYPPNFNGYKDPNKYPYEVVKFALDGAVKRAHALDIAIASSSPDYKGNSVVKPRPWLQDFDYGGNYDIAEVRAQINATYDAGLTSWMLWSPSNRYTTGALDKN